MSAHCTSLNRLVSCLRQTFYGGSLVCVARLTNKNAILPVGFFLLIRVTREKRE